MSGPAKTHGRFFGKWYISSHVINAYKKRVYDPRMRRLTKNDIEGIIIAALHDVDPESLESLPMMDDCYLHEVYFNPRGQKTGPFYLLLRTQSLHEPDKPAVVGLWTEEVYRAHLKKSRPSYFNDRK